MKEPHIASLVKVLEEEGLNEDMQRRVLRDIEVAASELALVRILARLPEEAAPQLRDLGERKDVSLIEAQKEMDALLDVHLSKEEREAEVESAIIDVIDGYLKRLRDKSES
jgi:hypothetical protein